MPSCRPDLSTTLSLAQPSISTWSKPGEGRFSSAEELQGTLQEINSPYAPVFSSLTTLSLQSLESK